MAKIKFHTIDYTNEEKFRKIYDSQLILTVIISVLAYDHNPLLIFFSSVFNKKF